MSVSYTVDVWCDRRHCLNWAFGSTGRGKPDAIAARAHVREHGWTRRRIDGDMVDLCPEHSGADGAPQEGDERG